MNDQNTSIQDNHNQVSFPKNDLRNRGPERKIAVWQVCCILAGLVLAGSILLTRLPYNAYAQSQATPSASSYATPSSSPATTSSSNSDVTPSASPSIKVPAQGASFQWQLQGTIDTSVGANVYDIDLFDNSADTVQKLHQQGGYVICYFSAGTAENWRSDYKQFQANAQLLGKADAGWSGENWVDIRNIQSQADPTQTTLGEIMVARLQQCKSKGFDGVEADNVDEYTNKSGFPLTAQDQLTYNRFLATQAHQLGLSIGLKNDSDQAQDLQPQFDWALEEECYSQGFCDQLQPFLDAHKAVFDTEYTDNTDTDTFLNDYCPLANAAGITAIYKTLDLLAPRTACPGTVTTH